MIRFGVWFAIAVGVVGGGCTTKCDDKGRHCFPAFKEVKPPPDVRGMRRACKENGTRCDALADHAKNEEERRWAYQRACDVNLAWGCVALAKRDGTSTAVAIPLFERGCELDGRDGCWHLGRRYTLGEGVARDEARGRQYLHSACGREQQDACQLLGRIEAGWQTKDLLK